MGLLTARRDVSTEAEQPTLTWSVDAALGFVNGAWYVSHDFVEDMFIALGLEAEAQHASPEVLGIIAAAIAALPETTNVPVRDLVDYLLDLRLAADRSPAPALCA